MKKMARFFVFFSLLSGSNLFCAQAQQALVNEVTPEQYGAKLNGVDDSPAIMKAISAAREKKFFLKLSAGKTYHFIPKATVDVTGMRGFSGTGTLDMSKAGPAAGNTSLKSVFLVKGKKKLLEGNIPLKKGGVSLSCKRSEAIKPGDVLFVTSAEDLPNRKRPYYAKGQRMVVKERNASGHIVFTAPFWYNIDRAYVWHLTEQPEFEIKDQPRFITAPMNLMVCFSFFFCRATIMGGYFSNFALTAVMYKSSEGVVSNMEADLPVTSNNGYSHCIQVGDLSNVTVKSCRLRGGRHVISGMGGGLWEKEESGGEGHAGYPSVLVVDGGEYFGTRAAQGINADNATIDSHGVVEHMTVKNCTIHGGINLGANYVLVENVEINSFGKRASNIGSDVEPGSDWGHYTIWNCSITAEEKNTEALFLSKADVAAFSLYNVIVKGGNTAALLMDFRYFPPKNIQLDKVQVNGFRNKQLIVSPRKTNIKFESSNIGEDEIRRLNY